MRIGIISDTHGSVPFGLANCLADCDAVLHAGDIGRQRTLSEIRSVLPSGTELYPVLGNTDIDGCVAFDEAIPDTDCLVFDNVAFVLAHEPLQTRNALNMFLKTYESTEVGDIVAVHGHVHVPKIDDSNIQNGIISLCPGALSDPREDGQRTVAKIDVYDSKVSNIQIESLNGSVLWDWQPK